MARRARRLVFRGVALRGVALVATAILAVACNQTGPGSPTSSSLSDGETPPREGPSTPPLDSGTGSESDTKVTGIAESVDDVGSQDRAPMAEGTLLVLPRDEEDRLWEIIEYRPSESELPYVSGLLEASDVEAWQLADIIDGRFGLDAPDGQYLVCLLAGEFSLSGCGEATVAGPTTWSVSRGEGGFEVRS